MSQDDVKRVLFELLDDLAALEHERGSHWQRYIHGKGNRQPDGSLMLPAERVIDRSPIDDFSMGDRTTKARGVEPS